MFDEKNFNPSENPAEQSAPEQSFVARDPAPEQTAQQPVQPEQPDAQTEQPVQPERSETVYAEYVEQGGYASPSGFDPQPQAGGFEQQPQGGYAQESYSNPSEPQPMFNPVDFSAAPRQGGQWNGQQYGGYSPYGAPAPEQKPPKKKMKKGVKRLIAAAVVVAVLGGAFGVFSIFYSIEPGTNGTLFSVERRGSHSDVMESSPTPEDNLSIYVSPSPEVEKNEPLKGKGAGEDGPQMDITESPKGSQLDYGDTNGALTPQQIAAKCTPSTVGVVATKYNESSYYYFSGSTSTSTGTGIIMSSDGYIITNHHVIEDATALSVVMLDGTEHEATLIGSDEKSDLAVLKIEAVGLTAAEFGDSDALIVGDPVYAIGNPLGLELMGTFTDGIVSAINRNVSVDERTMTLIQTNAAINSGNSGGPLINQYGQVVGINTLKMQNYSSTVEGLGFAIPTNSAKAIIDELIEKGYVSGYPAIGIRCDNVSESMSQYYQIPTGVLVRYVNPNANAYFAGLQVNDVIVEAQGQTVSSYSDLTSIMNNYSAGDDFTVRVYHYNSGEYETLSFKLNDENDFKDGATISSSNQ